MNSSYEQKHPLYAASSTKRRKAMDLYEDGERFEGNRAYLTRHTYESDKQYDIRASRATYRNFAAPIVDVFASFINEGRPERILPDALRPIEADTDRYGMTADAFFADVTRLAAAGGARFVIVDMEQKKGETVAGDKASGRRPVPYFTSISPYDVWDWGMDAKGLAWAVVHSEEMEHPAAFAAPLRYETLTVWTRDSWMRYRRPMKDKENTEYALTGDGERKHGLGAVPLVPFLFEPTSPMTGLPATDDVLSLILRIYRRDSELDKMLRPGRPSAQCGRRKPRALGHVRGRQLQRPHEHGTGRHHRAVRGAVGHRVSSAGRSPCPRRGQRAGNRPPYGPSAIRRGRVRRVQSPRQNAARHAACQVRPAQPQRGSPRKLAARWLGAKEDGIEVKYNERMT